MPEPWLKVPLFVKFPAKLRIAGALSIPVIVIPLKVVAVVPAIELVPLKVTVFVATPRLKVPLLVQVPATLKLPTGAVNIPAIMTLLKELVLEPEIVVVPPNVAVAVPVFNVPLFIRFPLIWKLEDGVKEPVTVIDPKVGTALPEIEVVPEKVIALEVSVEEALLTKFPFKSMEFEPALNEPLESVKMPFMVMLLPKERVPDPVLDRLANAVVLDGNSGPVVMVPVV